MNFSSSTSSSESSQPLTQLIYFSSALIPMTNEEFLPFASPFSDLNKERDITGILVYHDGSFLQVIEGEADKIDALYAKLHTDPRHTGLVKVAHKEIDQREFPSWGMAAKHLSAEEGKAIIDLFDIETFHTLVAPGMTKAKKVLTLMRDDILKLANWESLRLCRRGPPSLTIAAV